RTCRKVIEIEQGKAFSYVGNYSAFLIERELRREQQKREFENQQAYINKTEEFIRKNLAGQKTKQAKSRRTMLEKIDRIEAVSADHSSGNFQLKTVERAGVNVLMVEDLAIGYGEKLLANDINFTLHRGECLGIIGGNGTGKTTFLKTILGNQRELGGKIIWGAKTAVGYYSQQLEDLDGRNEIIAELRRVAPLAENGALRSFLARFLFVGEDVFKRVADLSGGEKGRLALAKLIFSNVNVLVLDEPTNHLDIPSREALESALESFPGTILTVSHDRFFLDQVSTQILSFEENCQIEIFIGNYSDFHEWKVKRVENREPTVKRKSEIKEETAEVKNERSNLSKNERQRIKQRLSEVESEITLAEENLTKISAQMNDLQIIADHSKFQALTNDYQNFEKEIQNLYAEWENLT
ncbi:MAG: ABC-F family ATP-binding cassette domain-containing protein, partial [Acidobacteriota bacterium]|nr:ABC-F family ATP-binding cassette domain-containing protein [Acidobacteriota bacterium]